MGAKIGKSSEGYAMHYSVGAVIKKDGKFLLIDRTNEPYGFAAVAGHIEDGEEVEKALAREVLEESGLQVTNSKSLFVEEVPNNKCNRGIIVHFWYVFECDVLGEPKVYPLEAKSIGWYSPEEMKNMKLEPVWEYWFKKMGVL